MNKVYKRIFGLETNSTIKTMTKSKISPEIHLEEILIDEEIVKAAQLEGYTTRFIQRPSKPTYLNKTLEPHISLACKNKNAEVRYFNNPENGVFGTSVSTDKVMDKLKLRCTGQVLCMFNYDYKHNKQVYSMSGRRKEMENCFSNLIVYFSEKNYKPKDKGHNTLTIA